MIFCVDWNHVWFWLGIQQDIFQAQMESKSIQILVKLNNTDDNQIYGRILSYSG